MFMNHLAGVAGYVMLIISILFALTMLYTALMGTAADANSMKILRVTIYVSIGIFLLDYLFGIYGTNAEAFSAFAVRIGLTALYGIVLIAASGISLIVSRIFAIASTPRRSDIPTIWRCLLHGVVITAVALALRWLLTGN